MEKPLAEWWQRLAAIFIDLLILAIPNAIIAKLYGVSLVGTRGHEWTVSGNGPMYTFTLLITFVLYFGYFAGSSSGQTPGKKVMKIAVRKETGESIGVQNGYIRAGIFGGILFVPYLSLVLGLLNALWPLWDPKRQAWHDKFVNSVVCKVD